jgi:hypothetical protein
MEAYRRLKLKDKGSLTFQILGTLGILAHFRHSLHPIS